MNNEPKRDVPPLLRIFGVKGAEKGLLDFFRVVFVLLLAYAVTILLIKSANQRIHTLDDLSNDIPRDSILYKSISEMDGDVQSSYVASINQMLEKPNHISKKLCKVITVSLSTAMLSEFIVSGNVTKPTNVVAKTFIFAILNTFFS